MVEFVGCKRQCANFALRHGLLLYSPILSAHPPRLTELFQVAVPQRRRRLTNFKPGSTDELKQAVGEWCSNPATTTYGPIEEWDTSLITDMRNLLRYSSCNPPIGSWDTSQVTSLE